jgi:NAD(P)H-hydrate repair Nnr-like enzyme with NAD(P)H-hydrate dehydratase domain
VLAVVGTIPDPDVPVTEGLVALSGLAMRVAGLTVAPDRGTPALLAATAFACAALSLPAPYAYLVGDEGLGHGSRALYRHLTDVLPGRDMSTLVFHYLMPDVMWHDKVLFAVEAMAARPRLIADAGFMYAAKMSGQAAAYDLFTPDAGELAFLADEDAPHPFYTRGFILHEENRVPDLIARAYRGENAAATLLVKGKTDYVADRTGVLHSVDGPSLEAMEAMGGTGDTLTGIAAALVESGRSVPEAARIAARANRLAGSLARPNPGSRIAEIIPRIPEALKRALASPP